MLKTLLADMYKGIFKFGVFNGVQSTCFDEAGRFNGYAVLFANSDSQRLPMGTKIWYHSSIVNICLFSLTIFL